MAKKGSATRILISIIFIALGLGSVVDALRNILDSNFEALFGISCVLGVLMFVLGIMGISKASMKACRVIAVIVCVIAVACFVMTVFTFNVEKILGGVQTTLVWALLAWIYFDMT